MTSVLIEGGCGRVGPHCKYCYVDPWLLVTLLMLLIYNILAADSGGGSNMEQMSVLTIVFISNTHKAPYLLTLEERRANISLHCSGSLTATVVVKPW